MGVPTCTVTLPPKTPMILARSAAVEASSPSSAWRISQLALPFSFALKTVGSFGKLSSSASVRMLFASSNQALAQGPSGLYLWFLVPKKAQKSHNVERLDP